ncbi:MAG: hypothetical protein HQL37_05575, partial [Alphaproteobacteria bacterium]|nr:hypothetical protein [Alphaproteobacteria bacterium]
MNEIVPTPTNSLLRQAVLRLMMATGLPFLLVIAIGGLIYGVTQEKMQEQRNRGVAEYFHKRVERLEQRWQTAAVSVKTSIEFLPLGEDLQQNSSRVVELLTALNIAAEFRIIRFVDSRGEVIIDFGGQREPLDANGLDKIGNWYFSSETGTLYRVYTIPVRLGTLLTRAFFYRAIDGDILYNSSYRDTELFVTWHGRIVANSMRPVPNKALTGKSSADAVAAPDAGMNTDFVPWPWQPGGGDVPILMVHEKSLYPFSLEEFFVIGVVTFAGLAFLFWFALGEWVTQMASRIVVLGNASHRFANAPVLTPELSAMLALGQGHFDDELRMVAKSLAELMRTVESRDSERNEYERELSQR